MISRRYSRILTAIVIFGASLLSFALLARNAEAATIHVNTTDMTIAVDGKCSLPEAVIAVNTQVGGDCQRGRGNDTIIVPVGRYAATAAMTITRSVTIRGAGNRSAVGLVFPGGPPVDTAITGEGIPASDGALFHLIDGGSPMTVTFDGMTIAVFSLNTVPISGIWGDQGSNSTINLLGSFVYGFGNPGIYTNGFSLNVQNSEISNNTNPNAVGSRGSGLGGGIYFQSNVHSSEKLTVANSTIDSNQADSAGGGIFCDVGTSTSSLINSTVSDNTSGFSGGGVYALGSGGTLNIAASTVAFNMATNDGGGIVVFRGDIGITTNITTSIVSNNSSPNSADFDLEGDGFVTVSNSLVLSYDPQNPLIIDGGGNVAPHIDPNLDPNLHTSNTGPFNVAIHPFNMSPVNPNQGNNSQNYQQTVSSPAVDYLTSDSQSTDQRGFLRGVSQFGGIGRGGSKRVDLGAYEFDPHMQTETTVIAAAHGTTPRSYTDTNFLNGQGIEVPATAPGQFATFQFISPRDGCYHVWVRGKTGPDEGQFQLRYSSDLAGNSPSYQPWGSVQDLYTPKTGYATMDLGFIPVNLVVGNSFYFQFLVAGKNRKSKGYLLFLDYLDVIFETSNVPC